MGAFWDCVDLVVRACSVAARRATSRSSGTDPATSDLHLDPRSTAQGRSARHRRPPVDVADSPAEDQSPYGRGTTLVARSERAPQSSATVVEEKRKPSC